MAKKKRSNFKDKKAGNYFSKSSIGQNVSRQKARFNFMIGNVEFKFKQTQNHQKTPNQ